MATERLSCIDRVHAMISIEDVIEDDAMRCIKNITKSESVKLFKESVDCLALNINVTSKSIDKIFMYLLVSLLSFMLVSTGVATIETVQVLHFKRSDIFILLFPYFIYFLYTNYCSKVFKYYRDVYVFNLIYNVVYPEFSKTKLHMYKINEPYAFWPVHISLIKSKKFKALMKSMHMLMNFAGITGITLLTLYDGLQTHFPGEEALTTIIVGIMFSDQLILFTCRLRKMYKYFY